MLFRSRVISEPSSSRVKDKAKTIHSLNDEVKVKKENIESNSVKDVIFNEPVLKKDLPVSPITDEKEELTFEFALNKPKENQVISNIADNKEEETEKKNSVVYDLYDKDFSDDSTEEQLRKSRERIMKLKSLSYRIGTANISDMEKEPAYKRRNIKLDSVPHSSESNVSRYTLSNEEEKKSELRQNNSFLHDNVD